MANEILAALVGGGIALASSLATGYYIDYLRKRNARKEIIVIMNAEIATIKERCVRYINGKSNLPELRASTPLLTSISNQIGMLKAKEIIEYRLAITLAMEMSVNGNKLKVNECIKQCEGVLKLFSSKI